MLYIYTMFGLEIGLSLSAYQPIEGTNRCYHGNQFWE